MLKPEESALFDTSAKLFDTHAHYDDAKFDADRDEILKYLNENGIEYIVDVGCSYDTMEKASRLAEKYDFVYASAGLHPNDTADAEARGDALEVIKSYLAKPKTVAIGEIGLDYYWDDVPRDVQKKWFEAQLCLAEETGYPVIIHDREAHGDTMEILRRHPKVKGILHSFSGSPEMADELVKMGWYISFSGVLTFKNAAKLPEVAKRVPLDRMLIETDAPYLAAHPHRGERNDSSLMKFTAAKLAEIKGITYSEVCALTTENAKRIYNIK